MTGLHIGVVGLGFGREFVPIYQRHPAVGRVSVADADPDRLARTAGDFGIAARHASLESLLEDPSVDAVHVATPVRYHATQVLAVLESGRHCACAVPMATRFEDLEAIVAAQERAGRHYMMMETTVFGREYLYVRQLAARGDLGDLTFYRGFHMQDLDGYPEYWMGYPPMHYITHALSPALALTGTSVESVSCVGSGRLAEANTGSYGNPFPLEAGLFRLRGHPMAVDVTMSFFQTARAYIEGFAVYGSRLGVEWPSREGDPLRLHHLGDVPAGHRGRHVTVEDVEPPDRADLLPEQIGVFTRRVALPTAGGTSLPVGGGHGGSHPHLVHEWLSSIVEDRPPLVDARTAAAWTAPGIAAHQSALDGGLPTPVPDFSG